MKRNISGKSVFKSSPTVTTFSAILVNSVVINEYTIRPILVESDKIVIILQQYRRTVDNSRQFYCHLTVLQQFRKITEKKADGALLRNEDWVTCHEQKHSPENERSAKVMGITSEINQVYSAWYPDVSEDEAELTNCQRFRSLRKPEKAPINDVARKSFICVVILHSLIL